jgi:hypothetical protein
LKGKGHVCPNRPRDIKEMKLHIGNKYSEFECRYSWSKVIMAYMQRMTNVNSILMYLDELILF